MRRPDPPIIGTLFCFVTNVFPESSLRRLLGRRVAIQALLDVTADLRFPEVKERQPRLAVPCINAPHGCIKRPGIPLHTALAEPPETCRNRNKAIYKC